MRIVLLGPPGSGKGTQAALLAGRLGCEATSTGALLRSALASRPDSAVGRAAAAILRGELVDDATANSLVESAVSGDVFLLDGYPRTVDQAEWLDTELARRGAALDAAIELAVPKSELVLRLGGRGRADDERLAVERRLEVHARRSVPVAEHYASSRRLSVVDGLGSPAEVHHRICEALGVAI